MLQNVLRTAAAMLAVVVIFDSVASTSTTWQRPAAAPAPADNHVTEARAELGRALFFDPRLSAQGSLSCASCHNPALGWSDGLPTTVGHNMKVLARSTPTIVNAAFNPLQMWDGRKGSLEDQALGPFGADEQNLPLEELERRVQSIAGYGPMFAEAYPGEPITRTTIAKAIASFERTVLSDSALLQKVSPADLTSSTRPRSYQLQIVTRGGAEMGRSESMPAWRDVLSEAEIQDVVAYVQTLNARSEPPRPLSRK